MKHRLFTRAILNMALAAAFILSSACAAGKPQAADTATPTLDSAATQTVQAKAALDAKATADVESTQVKKKTVEAASALLTKAAQQTQDTKKSYKETAEMDAKVNATAKAVKATTEAAAIYQQVQSLHDQGFIETTEGEYFRLRDFDESWAQLNWYQWWPTQHSPSDFVVSADASWESASTTANWFSAGCGFVFHANNVDNHYMVFLAMDGNAHLLRIKNGNYLNVGNAYFQQLKTPADQAKFTLAVNKGWITFLVNDKKVLRKFDDGLYEGELALTLNSGTNKDFGTRCQMSNIDLWELK